MWSPTALRRLAIVGGLVPALAAPMMAAQAAPADITVSLTPDAHIAAAADRDAGVPQGFDVSVGYAGSLTVQFSPLVAPGPGTEFVLTFDDGNYSDRPAPGYHWTFSTKPYGPSVAPLTVTDIPGYAYRIAIPPLSQVGAVAQSLTATLEVRDITTGLPRTTGDPSGEGLNARLAVSVGGPASAAVSTHPVITSSLPTVAAATGGVIRLWLPTSSSLWAAGMTTLGRTEISLHRANAGNLSEDWGPAEPITTSVSADGQHATIAVPPATAAGIYALEVKRDDPDLFVETAFLVDLAAADAAPASTSPAPVTTSAPERTSAPESTPEQRAAAAGTGAGAAGQLSAPKIQVASDSSKAWILWTGLGVVVLAAAGGAGFLVRRRIANR